MENPFDLSEIYKAIHSGGQNRVAGRDGLGLEFYKATWATIKEDICLILNHLFFFFFWRSHYPPAKTRDNRMLTLAT
jgi:hypothetical protein